MPKTKLSPQILALNEKRAAFLYIGYQHEGLREQSFHWAVTIFDGSAHRHKNTTCTLRIHRCCGIESATVSLYALDG